MACRFDFQRPWTEPSEGFAWDDLTLECMGMVLEDRDATTVLASCGELSWLLYSEAPKGH